ncbi:tail protein X [Massilia sp. DJPM01]|uniref:tail protein X n=1 Tax=Massilia sp. DJPM01 TaxID=3024404 RepID=UPI00259E6C6D|nr:tail protein X [Massilia sp. DJPM01]MDM5178529.1 tail protein X [Massilia sp. DJPM01]
MAIYITKYGDTADYITWKYYGRQDQQTVEQVLQANPGLADRGPTLPPNVRVNLPELFKPVAVDGPTLWT